MAPEGGERGDLVALRVVLEVAALDRLGIAYCLGGSFASSLHGLPRSTVDADLIADLRREDAARFGAALEGHFYLDPERIEQAITFRRSFNLIHLETMFKVDVFILRDDAAARRELERRQRFQVGATPNEVLMVASAEDVVLEKLRWFRLGNEVADRQWSDVLGVLRVQRGRLDLDYLWRSAEEAGLEDLLRRALDEAG